MGFHIAVDQQADVVPENIDAIRAICGIADRHQSVTTTNLALGIGTKIRKKEMLPMRASAPSFSAVSVLYAKDL